MATVYGCINPDLSITFENLETCLDYSACLVKSGVHAMQVALTLSGASNPDCNDTFYSNCFNPTTGKFQVVIPDDCCEEMGEDCQYCNPGETPYNLILDISEMIGCDCYCTDPPDCGYWAKGEIISGVNGTYYLEQQENPCIWKGKGVPYSYQEWYGYYGPPCLDTEGPFEGNMQASVAKINDTTVTIRIDDGLGSDYFIATALVEYNCVEVSNVHNDRYSCPGYGDPPYLQGGIAVITEG